MPTEADMLASAQAVKAEIERMVEIFSEKIREFEANYDDQMLIEQKLIAEKQNVRAMANRLIDERNEVIKIKQEAERKAQFIIESAQATAKKILEEALERAETINGT